MTITVKINGKPQEIELSDEQIIAIGQKYFALTCPTIELKPLDEAFCVPIVPLDNLIIRRQENDK